MLAVDALFTIMWLSAFATQASYNADESCGKACGISKGIVGLGVLTTYVSQQSYCDVDQSSVSWLLTSGSLLFAGTTFVSAFTLNYYQNNNVLPGYDNRQIRGGDNIDPDKAAFSMAPHDDEAYERVNMEDNEPTGNPYGGYNGSYNSTTRYGDNNNTNPYGAEDGDPARYGSTPGRTNTLFDNDTEYHSGGAQYGGNPTSGGYDDHTAHFPAGNYDRTH